MKLLALFVGLALVLGGFLFCPSKDGELSGKHSLLIVMSIGFLAFALAPSDGL